MKPLADGLEFARGPGRGFRHDGCETIRNLRDQGNADHVTGLISWTERHTITTDYFAWRTERDFTATFEAMLTQPLVIHDYGEVYYSQGVAMHRGRYCPVRPVLMAASSPSRSSVHGPHARRCAATSG